MVFGKLARVLVEAYEAACEGKQCLIARKDGGAIIIAPAPKFDPSAVEPPLLIAQDAEPCTCAIDSADPCPVHASEELRQQKRDVIRAVLRLIGICGHISGEAPNERVCVLYACEIDHDRGREAS